MTKSSTTYIEQCDFEGAKARFDSANARWKKHWFDVCVKIAETVKEWATKYIFDPINLTIEKIGNIIKNKIEKEEEEKVYLLKFYNLENELVFSKIGTTKRDINTRINEHLRYYRKEYGYLYCTLESVINCQNLPCEGAESYCRAFFIKKFPLAFKKNDRFVDVEIPVEDFENCVNQYLG
jgi:hypothetical protein